MTSRVLVFGLLACIGLATQPLAAAEPQQVIADLASDPVVRQAMRDIVAMDEQLIADMIELNEIPAPPFGEEMRGERFAEMLLDAGLTDVHVDEVGNVIGRRPGRDGKRVIVIAAHLDTVFPIETDVTVRVEGDTYYAPGIGDNSRGLVVVLAVLRVMQQNDIETEADVLFVGNVGEEGLGDLRGVKHLFRDGGPEIDAMISVDGGKTNRLVYAGVGSHRYRVTFRGPGGHSWGAFGRGNPHHALGRAIALFAENAPAVTADGMKTTFNVGRIGGGTSVNSVPFESWMEIDMRSGDQAKLDEVDAVLQAAVQRALEEENAARTRDEALTVDVKRIGTRPAAQGNIESGLVRTAAAAMRQAGLEPDFQISSTDANHPISIGVPAITLSRGGISSNSHAPAESWRNVDGHVAIHISLLTLLAQARLAD